jgi:hypothetical protein
VSTKSFNILSAVRRDRNGASETLTFKKGVNVIVGEPNTGKTRWLETIDFVLGDDGKVDDKLGEVVFAKYLTAELALQIGEEQLTVARRWHEAGAKTKIFVGEVAYDIGEFRQLLLDKLGIPSLHYPQGNPQGPRTWPELGIRSLFRHMYRRQRFWSDLADQQPASEQHAAILQFVGIAERLFSKEYGELVEKQKEIADLEAKREQFMQTLNEVSHEIVSEEELGDAVTPDAIAKATERLKAEVTDLNNKRNDLVTSAIAVGSARSNAPTVDAISKMTEEFAELKARERRHAEELERIVGRLAEVNAFQQSVGAEIGRLERAQKAGDVLANLKVTHCPVCDQSVKKPTAYTNGQCYLCNQPMLVEGKPLNEPLKRLEFELEQLKGERKESGDLIQALSGKRRSNLEGMQAIRNRTAQLSEQLRPVRVRTAAVIPAEVALLDNQVGQRTERIDQLRRIRESLARREKIADEIKKIKSRVEALLAEVASQTLSLDFDAASDSLSDGMNEYVHQLKFDGKKMWTQKDVQFSIRKDGFTVRVGRQKWSSQLGGTMVIYFLLGYHYSLLKISKEPLSRMPGFLMLDFPAEIEGEKVADHENFVIEPFIPLSKSPGYENVQVIAAGSAFKGLQGANRHQFAEVWT